MKRVVSFLCTVALCVGGFSLAVSAQTTAVYVTDASYNYITAGGIDGAMVYSAYEADGSQVLGTMDATGELTREAYSIERWDALLVDEAWQVTAHGDAGGACPYAHTHSEATVCPYTRVLLVTMHNTQTDVTIENAYVQSATSLILPDGVIHFCLGRYNYTPLETLRYAAGERYMARRDANGNWGVFDSHSGGMVTAYRYADMSAVYGMYAKVYNGTAWGRLDLSGRQPTAYLYDTADDFSVTEEVRTVDGGWQVFSKDNEAISPLITGEYSNVTYAAAAHTVLMTAADGTKTMIDLTGATVASFEKLQQVKHLQDACFAVTTVTESGAVVGAALFRVDNAPTATDTVTVGDVDMNGLLNTADARLILTALVGNTVLTERQTAAADVDGDGVITTADARELLKIALQIVE